MDLCLRALLSGFRTFDDEHKLSLGIEAAWLAKRLQITPDVLFVQFGEFPAEADPAVSTLLPKFVEELKDPMRRFIEHHSVNAVSDLAEGLLARFALRGQKSQKQEGTTVEATGCEGWQESRRSRQSYDLKAFRYR